MHCKYCGFVNGEEDHRCLRCGRRVGIAVSAPLSYVGNNALALNQNPRAASDDESQELFTQMPVVPPPAQGPPPSLETQPSLFAAQAAPNVIPFRAVQRPAPAAAAKQPAPAAPTVSQPKPAQPRKPASPATAGLQTTMDFTTVSLPKARVLQDSVTSEIFTHRPVAARMLRFAAGMLDFISLLFAVGLFCVIALSCGANFGTGNLFWITLGCVVGVIALLYSVFWSIVGPETFGMREVGLELINFRGQRLDVKTRIIRTPASWLSFCSAGLGIIWSLFDEETLTIHDHISKSFPTERDGGNTIIRDRH